MSNFLLRALITPDTAPYRFTRNKLFDRHLLGIIKEFAGYNPDVYDVKNNERVILDKGSRMLYRVSLQTGDHGFSMMRFRTCEKNERNLALRISTAHVFVNNVCYSLVDYHILRRNILNGDTFTCDMTWKLISYASLLYVSQNYIFAVSVVSYNRTSIAQYAHEGQCLGTFFISCPMHSIIDITDTEIYTHDIASMGVLVYGFHDLLLRKYPLPNDANCVCRYTDSRPVDSRHVVAAGINTLYLIGVNGVVRSKKYCSGLVHCAGTMKVKCDNKGAVYIIKYFDAQHQVSVTNLGPLGT